MWPMIFKKNVVIIARSGNISVYISWLTRFSFCRILVSALDAFQEVMRYVFKLLFHADDDAKGFRSSISSAAKSWRIDMVILLGIRMLCGIRQCCEKDYENGVIVFHATSSFRMCMFQIFACKSAWFCMWTKSLTLNLELSRVVLHVNIRVLNFVLLPTT